MKRPSRRWADYGGMLNAGLCVVHCAAGPLLLAAWGSRGAALSEQGDCWFLAFSGLAVAWASRRMASARLRAALWSGLALLGAAVLLRAQWSGFEWVQYGASFGLIGTHLLNLRHPASCAHRPHPPGAARP